MYRTLNSCRRGSPHCTTPATPWAYTGPVMPRPCCCESQTCVVTWRCRTRQLSLDLFEVGLKMSRVVFKCLQSLNLVFCVYVIYIYICICFATGFRAMQHPENRSSNKPANSAHFDSIVGGCSICVDVQFIYPPYDLRKQTHLHSPSSIFFPGQKTALRISPQTRRASLERVPAAESIFEFYLS